MKGEFEFALYPNEYYDSLLNELCSIETKKLPSFDIYKLICKKLNGFPVFSQVQKSESIIIYRVTDFKPNGIISSERKDYSYNPSGKLGRCNIEGQKVFYGALSVETALAEKQVEKNKEYFISKWEMRKADFILLGFTGEEVNEFSFFSDNINDAISIIYSTLSDSEKLMATKKYKFYNNLFSISGEKYYHLSSALSNSFLSLYLQGIQNYFVITYPSIAQNKNGINFAFGSEFADNSEHLELLDVNQIRIISNNDNIIQFKKISEGTYHNNKINWTRQ